MPVTEIGDPRLHALFGASDPRDAGVRPAVRLPPKGLPPLAIAIGAALLGVLLFAILNSRRAVQPEPSVQSAPRAVGATAWQEPPPLYIPPDVQPAPAPVLMPVPPVQQSIPKRQSVVGPASIVRPAPPIVYAPPQVTQIAAPPLPIQQPRTSAAGAPLVIDTGGIAAPPASGSFSALVPADRATARTRASALANRSWTISQGTMIPAVLETAFNSTQPGFARAIVSRDVRSFDGANVLIPRGSRLIGEYRSDVAASQKRAVIIWTRLIRPDGMTIVMNSPAVDTLGRGGVAATVNTHFFQRLGDALLQTTVGIGSAFAQRSVTGPVVVLPGAVGQATGQIASPTSSYVPTLTVPAGKSISIFVAHDLDFSVSTSER